jgi:hypothetical protein
MPNPFFVPLKAAVADVVGAAEVLEVVVGVLVGGKVLSGPPSLVVMLSKTGTAV